MKGDIPGSIEFACEIAGSKPEEILGHTVCDAVKGMCYKARRGSLTTVKTKR